MAFSNIDSKGQQAVKCSHEASSIRKLAVQDTNGAFIYSKFGGFRLWDMSERIAQQLSALYRELAERRLFSDTVRVPLTEAGASGHALRMVIFQCDTDDLTLVSIMRQWWIVDESGLHSGGKFPFSTEMLNTEGALCKHPYIKFATDGNRIRFGLRFGENWYVSREGPIGPDGRFIAEDLVDVYRGIRPEPK